MPFKSQSQRGYLYANHPDIAARFASETPKGKKLPKRVKKNKPMHRSEKYKGMIK